MRLLATPRPHGGHDYGHDMNAASFDGPDILKVAAVRWRPAITAPPAVPHQAAHELHHQTAHSACSHAPHYMWHTSNKGFSSRGGVCIDRGGFVDSNIPSKQRTRHPPPGLHWRTGWLLRLFCSVCRCRLYARQLWAYEGGRPTARGGTALAERCTRGAVLRHTHLATKTQKRSV